jgi:photosystem II stability/assembly factor-like uncharacterized protein
MQRRWKVHLMSSTSESLRGKGVVIRRLWEVALSCLLATAVNSGAQGPVLNAEFFRPLELRSIGPASTPGRIADIVVNPRNRNIWYLAVASGGLWKTTNRGISWTPIFDEGGSYSLGCIMLDPADPNVVWLGTGENQASRSMSFGDGVYKSTDAGQTWRRVGLANSEHIARILIDPRNSQVVYVASQGSLWAPGGDRGLFKTVDGGTTWKPVLQISENTGITDLVLDPRDPNVLYAASYQRRRNVGICIGGGPEAGIFKSVDGGATWNKLTSGIPSVDLGRIALALSPQNPDIVYALIVAAGTESGFFRSSDRGVTWVRQSNYRVVDPQYYGEIYPDPHHFDRIYAMDVTINVTDDGGKRFQRVPWQIHVDNHAMTFDPTDPDHLLVGNDGGLYETCDGGNTWRHFNNLSTVQYYRVAVDNAVPFYNVYGGSQDNGSHGGPSRTINRAGIRSSDWITVGGGDGMQARIDPKDPNIVYSMSQNAALSRLDKRTSVSQSIRPRGGRASPVEPASGDANQPAAAGGPAAGVRWNWDAPLIVSSYAPTRLYLAGSRLLRSDDRGDNWTPVSEDLTRQINRDTLLVMGRTWDSNAVTKNLFTTDLGVASALSESPLMEGLLYVGTDDGLVQVSRDGGKNWRRIEQFTNVPDMSYVSDLFASRHDVNTVYAAFNNYQRGDFTPYLLKSTDQGDHWVSIRNDLPDRNPVWCIIEDPVNRNLLFTGTEFGLFFTIDGGTHWIQLRGGVPTIAFRDLEIQPRETDLVCATFGRGFFILDDYSPLRTVTSETLAKQAVLFTPRKACVYNELSYVQAAYGDYTVPNPPLGALLTYYLKEGPPQDQASRVVLTVTDADGRQVRQIDASATAGLHRVSWDLRSPAAAPSTARGVSDAGEEEEEEEEAEVSQSSGGEERQVQADANQPGQEQARGFRQGRRGGFGRGGRSAGPLVKPGRYTITLGRLVDGTLRPLGEPQTVEVVPLN